MAWALKKLGITFSPHFVSGALVLLALCVFGQIHSFGFIKFDDPSYVTSNARVLQGLTWESVKWAFTGIHGENWHPLTTLSHLLDVQIFGLRAGMHHLVNLAFHTANVLLLFAVLRRMTGSMWCCALVAALFAIHPLRVESVVWVSERKDVLSGFFWMVSLFAYWRYVRRPGMWKYLETLGLFALGLLSKPMVVTFPLILLLVDFWPLRRLSFKTPTNFVSGGGEQLQRMPVRYVLLEKLPMLAMSLAAGLMTMHVQRQAMVAVAGLPIQIRLYNSALSYIRYVKKTAWPFDLAIFYPFQREFSLHYIVAAVFLLVAVTFVVVAVARIFPYVLTGWLWYLVTLIPVIGVLQVGSQSYADRYTYIPTIGIYIVIAWGLKDVVQRFAVLRVPIAVASVLVVGTLSVLAANYASLWRSDERLLLHALQVTKNNASAHCTLGEIFLERGQYDRALAKFDEALKINSALLGGERYSQAHIGKGLALLALGRTQEAEKSFRRAIELAPKFARAHVDLGITLEKLGKWGESLQSFQEAMRLAPDEPFTHSNLAIAYLRRGRIDEAAAQYREALSLYPDNVDSLKGLAWILATDREARRRNPAEALMLSTKACKMTRFQDPGSLEILAAAQAENGDFETASATAQKALDLIKLQGSQRDKALEQRVGIALELYRSEFVYRR